MVKIEEIEQLYPNEFTITGGHTFKGIVSFRVKAPMHKLFSTLSNTSLINKRLKLTPREEEEIDGNLNVFTSFIGIDTQWIERPWQWSYGRFIIANREYIKGAFNWDRAVYHIVDLENEEYEINFLYIANAKSILIKTILNLTFNSFGKKVEGVIKELLLEEVTEYGSTSGIQSELSGRIRELGIEKDLSKNLAQLIMNGDEDELDKIHLPKLVRSFNRSEKELLDALLILAKNEILTINWEVQCPHCRGDRSSEENLRDLINSQACAPCRLLFNLDDVSLIDVNFRINEKIRKIRKINYCAGEPFKKSHILLNLDLKPGESTEFKSTLNKGQYRLRNSISKSSVDLEISSSQKYSLHWDCVSSNEQASIGGDIEIIIKNSADKKLTVVLEEVRVDDNYLSPIQVFNNSIFQKLYSDQSISSGVQLKLPKQIILFTDVVGSTAFYEKVGDVEAYNQINAHFKIVHSSIEKFDGMIVKTIGDAVMATFQDPIHAVSAIKEIDKEIVKSTAVTFNLRYSIHYGPVIAVNYNTGIDYFGNHVNYSAKLQAICEDHELAMSEEFYKSVVDNGLFGSDIKIRTYLNEKKGHVISL